jgi:phage terminase large subunit GpA-like protein
MLHPIYSLKRIFVEKALEGLTLFPTRKNIHQDQMQLSENIDRALRRPTERFRMKQAKPEIELSGIGTDRLEEPPDMKTVLI